MQSSECKRRTAELGANLDEVRQQFLEFRMQGNDSKESRQTDVFTASENVKVLVFYS